MSDSIEFDPETLKLRVPRALGTIEGDAHQTMIFLHGFEYRGADHIFVGSEVIGDEPCHGIYVFRAMNDELMNGRFDDLTDQLIRHGFSIYRAESLAEEDEASFEMVLQQFVGAVSTADLEKPWGLLE